MAFWKLFYFKKGYYLLLCAVMITMLSVSMLSINIRACEDSATVKILMQAVTEGQVDSVKALLSDVPIDTRDCNGRTALMIAVLAKQIDSVHTLLQAGADLEAYDRDGYTTLLLATSIGHVQIVQALIRAGADLEAFDRNHRHDTALILVTRKGNIEVMKLLVQAGADLKAVDNEGLTALMWAAIYGKTEMAALLIQAGADVEMCDDKGFTPLAYAMGNDHQQIVKLLEARGANRKYATEFLNRKFLAAAWGLSGKSKFIDQEGDYEIFSLEGLPPRYILQKLPHYIRDFFHLNDEIDTIISKENQQKIYNSIANTLKWTTCNQALSKLKLGQPIAILGGSCTHTISMVIVKKQEDYLLFICNRGEDRTVHTTETYLIQSELTQDMIKQLIIPYRDMSAFNHMIANLPLIHLGGFNKKDQKVGNCSWANGKGAFEILCRWYAQEGDADHQIGADIYKRFTGFARTQALKEYLESDVPNKDLKLLQAIKKKYHAKQTRQKHSIVLSEDILTQLKRTTYRREAQ